MFQYFIKLAIHIFMMEPEFDVLYVPVSSV